MSGPRDTVTAARAQMIAIAKARGIDLQDILRESRDPRQVDYQLGQVLNGSMPTTGRAIMQCDLPPVGVFDGLNTDYTLSRQPLGLRLTVLWVNQATGTLTKLERSSNPAPPAGSYYFDGAVTIRLGVAPATADNVAAIYDTNG